MVLAAGVSPASDRVGGSPRSRVACIRPSSTRRDYSPWWCFARLAPAPAAFSGRRRCASPRPLQSSLRGQHAAHRRLARARRSRSCSASPSRSAPVGDGLLSELEKLRVDVGFEPAGCSPTADHPLARPRWAARPVSRRAERARALPGVTAAASAWTCDGRADYLSYAIEGCLLARAARAAPEYVAVRRDARILRLLRYRQRGR